MRIEATRWPPESTTGSRNRVAHTCSNMKMKGGTRGLVELRKLEGRVHSMGQSGLLLIRAVGVVF
jgi:hypothetical protein